MDKKGNRFCSWLGLLVILSVVFPASVFPQDLNERIKKLEQLIARLEQRIEKLEGIMLESQKSQAKPVVASPNRWKDKANWRLLKKGMNKNDVERILGEPPKIVTNAYYGDTWYYPDLQGGNASFNTEDVLTSWSEI